MPKTFVMEIIIQRYKINNSLNIEFKELFILYNNNIYDYEGLFEPFNNNYVNNIKKPLFWKTIDTFTILFILCYRLMVFLIRTSLIKKIPSTNNLNNTINKFKKVFNNYSIIIILYKIFL